MMTHAMTNGFELFLALCLVAGAVHVVAPDHWVPASILGWRRSWGSLRVSGFASLAYAVHLLLGAALYFLFAGLIDSLPSQALVIFSIVLVVSVTVLRAIRFNRIREVIRGSNGSLWGVFTVCSLLGPCESIIPILVKARSMGIGYLSPLLAFYAGTLLAGLGLILSGRIVWNRPHWLPRGIRLAETRVTALPVLAGMVIGLTYLLRLTA